MNNVLHSFLLPHGTNIRPLNPFRILPNNMPKLTLPLKNTTNVPTSNFSFTNEFDCIDSDLIIDTIIPKGPPSQLSNECESIFSDSIISSCKYPKRRNNDIDEIKTLLKLEHEKMKLELEMTKNRYNEYAICHVMVFYILIFLADK
ncbi:unnamed protein product [Gordionus sp. m RMFG-2023]